MSKRSFSSIESIDYIYQKKDYYPYHCGPFALYNLLLKNNKYIGLNKLIKLCEPEPNFGTSNIKFNNAIKKLNEQFNIEIVETEPTIQNIKNILTLGKQIIILFHWSEHYYEGEHFALIDEMINQNEFKFVNYSFVNEIKIVKLRELKNMLRYYKSNEDICPTLWFIK